MLEKFLIALRDKKPLVHCITNYVTVNDCANMLLAAGACPTMADTPEEMEEIVSLADALSVNIGTLSEQSLAAMIRASRHAKKIGKTAVLDPVGAGASTLRTRTARELLDTAQFTLVRGNISEMKALAGLSFRSRGVDASAEDAVTEVNYPALLESFGQFALKHRCVVQISGAVSLLSDGKRSAVVRNGHPVMARVTGTGCMLTVLSAAFLASSPDQPFEAAVAAICAMGVCGEIAASRMQEGEGNASFRTRLIDAMYNLDSSTFERMAKYEIL